MLDDCMISDILDEKQSFKASPPMSRWFRIQKERRNIKDGTRVSTHRFMALEPTCGNFFCINPDHMVEVAYSPAMAAVLTSPHVHTDAGRDWDACFAQSGSGFDMSVKTLVQSGWSLKFTFDKTCGAVGCVNPNHYRMKTTAKVGSDGKTHRIATSKFLDRRSGVLNSTGKSWLYMDLARGIGDGGSARVVDAEQTCNEKGCVSCWKVTKVWKCQTVLGEEISGWPWKHATESLPFGGLDEPLTSSVEVVGGGASSEVNAAVNEFSPRAGRMIAEARRSGSCAIWTGAEVNGYPCMSGVVGAHRRIIELENGISLKYLTVRSKCGHRGCLLPEHWTGWEHLKTSESLSKEVVVEKRMTTAANRRIEKLENRFVSERDARKAAEAEVEEMKRKLAEMVARLNGVGGGGAP